MKKRILLLMMCAAFALGQAGCGSGGGTVAAGSSEAVSQDSGEVSQEPEAVSTEVDGDFLDLSVMSGTMVYAEVYNIMYEPDKYVGKTIKMKGLFAQYMDEERGQRYYACVIQDATACCAQGIEFVLQGEHQYPEDYPKDDTEICVTGVFELYKEGHLTFCRLKDAHMEIV